MSALPGNVGADNVPRHIAVIMDGNGRWAQARGKHRLRGHRAGCDAARSVVHAARELGVSALTLYAFSTENWNRPRGEIDELMRLLERYLDRELGELRHHGVRVRSVGRTDRLPARIRTGLAQAEAATGDNRGMELVVAVSYGGRDEIVDAARRLALDVECGAVDPEQIDDKVFARYLYAPDLPDPDLLIRTGGESRLSNFLLWQCAYTELYVTDVMWPDFDAAALAAAIRTYQGRERRYGRTSAQVRRARERPGGGEGVA